MDRMKEELIKINMKECILDKWKSKLSYPLNYKDIEELENIIDYYEQQNQKLKDRIEENKEDISSLMDVISKNCNELKCTSDEWLVIKLWQDRLGGDVDDE